MLNFQGNNYINQIYYIINNIELINLDILSKSLYTNINNIQKYLIFKLVLVLKNYLNSKNFMNLILYLFIIIYINNS